MISARSRHGRLAGAASIALAVATLATSGPLHADDLREALVQAYQTNPTLQSARTSQRALDETPGIERAAGLPGASVTATHTELLKQNLIGALALTNRLERQLNATANVSVPVYSGGAVRNAVRAAKTRVEAGQADLRATEASVFSQVVAAYMDVMLQQAIVGLNRNNMQVLEVNLQATTDRFEIGDLTRTDVAQSQARLALAQGDVRTAEADLAGARERYIQIVGKPPVGLETPPPLPGLPATPEEATAIALENNPDVLAARERSKASEYDIGVAGASRLPKVEVFATGSYIDDYGTLRAGALVLPNQSGTNASAGVRASIPIFQGGRPAALRRQAQARAGATLEQEIAVERDVIAQARAAFASWKAANDLIASTQTAVDAAALSLEGVRAENSVGNRTILEILNAEQELLQARVRLETAKRNAYVAGFTLLASIGRAEAQDLGLDGGPLYDPDVNYRRVRGKVFDWESDPAPKPQSTRTVDMPVQDGSIPRQ